MKTDLRPQHRRLLEALKLELVGNSQPLRVKKRTISNLFRYEGRLDGSSRLVDLSRFNQPLYLDPQTQTLEVQGLATYEQIVDFLLPQGFLPTVVPELKHITVGGATVGIGIETNSYRYGFVHDGLLEADVLLPDGTIVTVTADNQYSDLFYGLPNSYGTLGYIIRAKIRLLPAKPFVRLSTAEFNQTGPFLAAMKAAASDPAIDYIEGLAYSSTRLYLTSASQTKLSSKTSSIYGQNIFYRRISHAGETVLPTKDYLFRYDPEWFWNIPESKFFNLFRQIAPTSIRNSGFYARYNRWQQKIFGKPNTTAQTHEALIQDWEVPWIHAPDLLEFVLNMVDLEGKPLMAAPLKTPAKATCYPMLAEQLYLNLGSYSYIKKPSGQPDYYTTKAIDQFCFGHQGIKMLYSSTFITPEQFNNYYNGQAYAALKQKYDPKKLLPTLYEKAVKAR